MGVFVDQIVTANHSNSMPAEQYRVLCARLEKRAREKGYKTIAVTSAVQGEGKTFTILNLAVAMAKDFGYRVLLVEADFKNPGLSRLIRHAHPKGFFDLLTNGAGIEAIQQPYLEGRLNIITAGRTAAQSLKLVISEKMKDLIVKTRDQYDYIFFDLPPVLATADANVLMEWMDGVILVVRAGKTPREAVLKAVSESSHLIGVVLNDVKSYFSYSYYYYYSKTD
jgi:capsular exopolysaccharide synthesis family protein